MNNRPNRATKKNRCMDWNGTEYGLIKSCRFDPVNDMMAFPQLNSCLIVTHLFRPAGRPAQPIENDLVGLFLLFVSLLSLAQTNVNIPLCYPLNKYSICFF